MTNILRKNYLFIISTLLISCYTTDNLIKNKEYSITDIDILEDKVEYNLVNDIKIVQVSDLHFERKKSIYDKVINEINSIKPDILFITGDSVEFKKNINLLDDFLNNIDHSIIKYSILGNHEYWGEINFSELERVYNKYNCKLLINKGEKIILNDNEINIYGTDEYTENKDNLDAFYPDNKSLNIILTHCPVVFDKINKYYPDRNIFVFSGHTHGGEITFFGKPILLPKGSGRYVKGKFIDKGNTLYVSKGIGSGGLIDIRIFANRDIILINFKNNSNEN